MAQPDAADQVSSTGELGIDDVVRFVRSAWPWGAAMAILAGGATGGYLISQPRVWESSASLLVAPALFRSELKTDAMSLPAYQRLLESAAVVDATRTRLRAAGILAADDRLEVGTALESRVITAKRSEETVLAPFIEVKGRGKSPEAATAIADTWIACFLEHSRTLAGGNLAATVTLVDNQYQEQLKRLNELEDRRLKAAVDYKKQSADLQEEWNTRLAACRAETGDLLTRHQNETARLLAEVRAEQKLSQRQAEVDALTKALGDLKSQISMAAVFRAMGPDQVGPPDSAASPSQAFARLRDQERQLTERLALAQSSLARDTQTVDSLQRTRENAYNTLSDQRAALLASLTAKQRAALEALRREESSQLDRLDQELLPLRELVAKLARDANQVHIAKAQQSVPDVRIASAAVKPEAPMSRGAASKAVMAAVLGAMAGFAIALYRTIARRLDGKAP